MDKKYLYGLQTISQADFVEHIEDEDFFRAYGNPVIIQCDSGFRLVCIAWELCERLMREAGRGDEADEIIRRCAETADENTGQSEPTHQDALSGGD